MRVPENLIDRKLPEEVDLRAVPDPLHRVRLDEDLELLARLFEPGDYVLLEDVVATVRSKLLGHDLA